MKSAIYMANTNTIAEVESGSIINLGNVYRRFGCNVSGNGDGIAIKGAGYYDIDANFSITPSAADTVTVQLYKDGVPVTGARAIASGSADKSMHITALVREICDKATSVLTFVVTAETAGTTMTIDTVGVVVEKI